MKNKTRRRPSKKKHYSIPAHRQADEQREASSEEIEYIPAPVFEEDSPLMEEFSGVLAKFQVANTFNETEENLEGQGDKLEDDYDMELNEEIEDKPVLSKKKLRKMNRISLAELKQWAPHPEVVEWEDVTAPNPKLLTAIKCSRHTVPVPHHWSQKRKYLAGKRGYVKPPFELPSFIRDTGITELRDKMRAEDAAKRIKVKARERMHPKLGRISVDYEKLYDAFFKYQTKPPLTAFGELYYEGKETQDKRRELRPGYLSEELRAALGMNSVIMPPPWLLAMQKHGMPPSYPTMKIAGLNAPIPEGAQWGYHPGGWGKPIVDDFLRGEGGGRRAEDDPQLIQWLIPVERNLWGELEPDDEVLNEEFYELDDESPTAPLDDEDGNIAVADH